MQDHRRKRAAPTRKNMGFQKTMEMRTEYMDRFLPPLSYKKIVSTLQKHPNHQLKGTSAVAATFKMFHVAPKRVKNLPKQAQLTVQPKGQQRTSCAQHNPKRFEQQEDNSLEVNKEPFERTTSYRTDYVAHPVQPRTCIQKPSHKSNKDLISGPTRHHEKHLSTTHADFTAHKCQYVKPILPTAQHFKRSLEPFQSTTTMKEDFKALKAQRRCTVIPKQQVDCSRNPKTADTTSSLRPERRETVVCNIYHSPQTPAESKVVSGFECICNRKESRMFWTTSVGRGVTQTICEVCVKPCEDQQVFSCMVSSKAYNSPKTGWKKKRDAAASSREVSAFTTKKSQK